MKKHSTQPPPAAFTLIELLVVIAIIAVLAGLIFPVVGKVRIRGVETRTTSNLRQIGAAMAAYSGERDGALPGPLTVEQYPTFGADSKHDVGSLAKLLAPFLGLAEKKGADKDKEQLTEADVFACPGATGPKREEIPGYIMNVEQLPDTDPPQSAWGDIKEGKDGSSQPLRRAALGTWRDKSKTAAENGNEYVNLTTKWAMRHTDKVDCEKLGLSGEWVEKLPEKPVFGYDESKPKEPGRYQTLFFDLHVEAYKPTYEEKTGGK